MRVCCLTSGGKDSIYACHWAFFKGFDVKCLLTVKPSSSESMLFHYPAVGLTKLQAEAMGLPRLAISAPAEEEQALSTLFREAAEKHGAQGVVTGAVLSDYQRLRFSLAAEEAGLRIYAPLWRIDQYAYMRSLVREGFEFIIVSISAMGLPPGIMGRPLSDKDIELILRLAGKYGFNPAFEGGEAETLVTDAPLFRRRLKVNGYPVKVAEDVWLFKITEAVLEEKIH